MNRQVLVSLGSAVLGGLAGAALVSSFTPKESALAGEAVAQQLRQDMAQLRQEVQARLSDLDRSIDQLERAAEAPRAPVLPPLPAAAEARAPAAPADDTTVVDDPVFEAAVRDIIERSVDARAAERAAAREEKQRQRDKYWAEEVTMRLGLTPTQSERLLGIQAQLNEELDRVRDQTADGRYVPRETRRDARQAARQRADDQLRAILTRQQAAAYDALDTKLKIFRPRDD